jgi:RNA polymerase sigma factor (sigma-70 family)
MPSTTGSGSKSQRTDEGLLRDYATSRDAAAFAAIVQRHGPMVLGVCRRVLRREHDAEDAFQATFLVLMHKARSLTRPKLLANWLYGVAYRTALKARLVAARQRRREKPIVKEPAVEPAHEGTWNDLRPILDDELSRLPQKLRAPVVLCYLEGQTTQEAARAVGCPQGTILSRLARARQRLRSRLTRRGLVLSSGVLATLLCRTTSLEAAMPGALLKSISGQGLATPAQTTQTVSAHAADLAQRIMKSMLIRKLLTSAGLMLVAVLGIGIAVFGYRVLSDRGYASDAEKLQGTWKVVAVEGGSFSLPEEQFPYTRLTVRGATITTHGRRGNQEKLFRLDPEPNPKHIDMWSVGYEKETRYGIYALDGETLKICLQDKPRAARPTEFASAKWSRIVIITAKRTP